MCTTKLVFLNFFVMFTTTLVVVELSFCHIQVGMSWGMNHTTPLSIYS